MQKLVLRLFCAECGNILETNKPDAIKNEFTVLVVPCKNCVEKQVETAALLDAA
jgi:hypothetical protein